MYKLSNITNGLKVNTQYNFKPQLDQLDSKYFAGVLTV